MVQEVPHTHPHNLGRSRHGAPTFRSHLEDPLPFYDIFSPLNMPCRAHSAPLPGTHLSFSLTKKKVNPSLDQRSPPHPHPPSFFVTRQPREQANHGTSLFTSHKGQATARPTSGLSPDAAASGCVWEPGICVIVVSILALFWFCGEATVPLQCWGRPAGVHAPCPRLGGGNEPIRRRPNRYVGPAHTPAGVSYLIEKQIR